MNDNIEQDQNSQTRDTSVMFKPAAEGQSFDSEFVVDD